MAGSGQIPVDSQVYPVTMLPELSALRLLTEVARLGSIGAAGRAVGISQQSASERLRAMETQTGLVLVRRAPRGSELTDAGQLLVEWSKDLLERADEIDSALDTLRRGRTRELRVHASLTTAEYLLPRWLVQFRRTHDVPVSLRAVNSDDVVAAVRAAESDLGAAAAGVALARAEQASKSSYRAYREKQRDRQERFIRREMAGLAATLDPAARGEVLQEITLPGKKPSNLCFGGPDGRTIYVTEMEHGQLVQFRVDRPGLEWSRWKR